VARVAELGVVRRLRRVFYFMKLSDQILHWGVISTDFGIHVAICIASLVAARSSSFRLVFSIFTVAAALSALSTALVILFSPYAYFAFTLPSKELYRAMFLLQPVGAFASSILFGIGFFMLVRRVLTLPPNSNVA
jgi:hypothetical protein